MHLERRQLLTGAALAGLGLAGRAAAAAPATAKAAWSATRSDAPKLLVLGGTGFLGPHLVDAALARGFEVTLFNRGRSDPGLFPDLETLIGDRDPERGAGLGPLEGDRRWDYVIDTTSYVPRLTKAVCDLLADRIERYALISTVSVYAELGQPGIDELAPVGRLDDPTTETVDNATYGPLKALCEEAAEAALPGRVVNVRPGLIVGPRDRTDRFTYWPVRVRRGGRIIAPGSIDDPVQFIDARDLAEFTLHCLVEGHTGTFNATGPTYGLTVAGLLYGCRAATTSDARFEWVSTEQLQELGLSPWVDLPVWAPPIGPMAGMNAVSTEAGAAVGLRSRPLADTVRDTLAWWDEQPEERRQLRWGLDSERESAALAALDRAQD